MFPNLGRILPKLGKPSTNLGNTIFLLNKCYLILYQRNELKRIMNKLTFSIINQGGKAEIRIVGHIGSWEANSEKFTNEIDQLINSGVQDLDVYINSFGGSVLEANEIINQLRRFKGTKTVQVGSISGKCRILFITIFSQGKKLTRILKLCSTTLL